MPSKVKRISATIEFADGTSREIEVTDPILVTADFGSEETGNIDPAGIPTNIAKFEPTRFVLMARFGVRTRAVYRYNSVTGSETEGQGDGRQKG